MEKKQPDATQNKMAVQSLGRLIRTMGLPMIVSMVLQALYNVVDSIFVANMREGGAIANQALTLAFPIQILMIAIGVGTGIGINACLSRSLGENDREKVDRTAGNGIFLSFVIFAVFLIFGLFFTRPFISAFTDNEQVIEKGASYLKICCCFSYGTIGYTAFERFLQATGKTMFSTIAQISGAAVNIVLDYVFIFPLDMGVSGAAWATIIGQFVSLFVAAAFHYLTNREIRNHPKNLKPKGKLIAEIYRIGISAAIMQALLPVMMAGMNAVLGSAKTDADILVGSFGIYYKIQQIALFSAFGLSNTIITVLSFNYGLRDKARVKACIRCGISHSLAVTFLITVLFFLIAQPLSKLFSLSGDMPAELIRVCETATREGAVGFVFMGFVVAVQGVLQALGYAGKPLVLALLRLVVFVFPVAFLFTLADNAADVVWWTFPIAEVLTSVVAVFFLRRAIRKKAEPLGEGSLPA